MLDFNAVQQRGMARNVLAASGPASCWTTGSMT